MNEALRRVRAEGLEPTRRNIDRAFRDITSGRVQAGIFGILRALEALDGTSVDIWINEHGYGSNYMPVGSHGSAGGYAQYVNNPGMVGGKIVEGTGGKMYRETGDPARPYEPLAGGGPTSAGGSYLVGERGPELFTPGQSGSVSSNDDLKALTNAINRMVTTLPTVLRDAVEKAK
jgi:hypothetical protein